MKVYLHSVRAERMPTQAEHLRYLRNLDPECPHDVVEDPGDADVVLLTDAAFNGRLLITLLRDKSLLKHWDKALLYSEDPTPPRLFPGVYTSLPMGEDDATFSRAIGYPGWTGAMNPAVLGHEPAAERQPNLLYSFCGRICHPVRRALLRNPHDKDLAVVTDTTRTYRHLVTTSADAYSAQRAYLDLAVRSKFALCPRGYATSSIRLYEMMALGVAPVILADGWRRPAGVDWDAFALFVPERDAARVADVLKQKEGSWEERGRLAREAWESHFRPERQFRTLAKAVDDLRHHASDARNQVRMRLVRMAPKILARANLRTLGQLVGR